MSKKDIMYERINSHGQDLRKIFPATTEYHPINLSKLVMRREIIGRKLATDYCNGVIDTDRYEYLTDKLLDSLDKLLGFRELKIPVFVNDDARGYALKINDQYVRDNNIKILRDLGGYGILAPDFREEG